MAPSIAGTNKLTQMEDSLATLLSRLPAFQTFVGAANEAEAL